MFSFNIHILSKCVTTISKPFGDYSPLSFCPRTTDVTVTLPASFRAVLDDVTMLCWRTLRINNKLAIKIKLQHQLSSTTSP